MKNADKTPGVCEELLKSYAGKVIIFDDTVSVLVYSSLNHMEK